MRTTGKILETIIIEFLENWKISYRNVHNVIVELFKMAFFINKFPISHKKWTQCQFWLTKCWTASVCLYIYILTYIEISSFFLLYWRIQVIYECCHYHGIQLFNLTLQSIKHVFSIQAFFLHAILEVLKATTLKRWKLIFRVFIIHVLAILFLSFKSRHLIEQIQTNSD